MSNSRKIDRRKFVKVSTLTSVAGVSALMLNFNVPSATAKVRIDNLIMGPEDTKEVFRKCGTCSQTFFHILNREFGHTKEIEELASNPLAGGLMLGHQCGMLWGSVLAVGTESFYRNADRGVAIASAIMATRQLMDSFTKKTASVNCRDISHVDVTKKSSMAKFMLQIILHGGLKHTPCFNLAEKWAPEAIQSAAEGLSAKVADLPERPLSCASEVVAKMGGSDEEMVMAAGFAGGMGLKGHACGALAAAIWMNTLNWCKKHPGERPPQLKESNTPNILKTFYRTTDSEILCQKITRQYFATIKDHTEYMNKGGCNQLIDSLSLSATSL